MGQSGTVSYFAETFVKHSSSYGKNTPKILLFGSGIVFDPPPFCQGNCLRPISLLSSRSTVHPPDIVYENLYIPDKSWLNYRSPNVKNLTEVINEMQRLKPYSVSL